MNFKINKKSLSVIGVYAIILALYIVAFLAIPFPKIAASWIIFAFTVVSILSGIFICGIAFGSDETVKSKIYGFPVFRIGVAYTIIQLLSGIIICIIGSFLPVPYWIALILSLVLLGACIIGVIITDNSRDFVESIEEDSKKALESFTEFKLDAATIADICTDDVIKKELEKLNEAFRFSDPVSSEKTAPIEAEISEMLAALKYHVESSNNAEAAVLIKKISQKLAERNRICKAYKN